jgi:hypothetical protein
MMTHEEKVAEFYKKVNEASSIVNIVPVSKDDQSPPIHFEVRFIFPKDDEMIDHKTYEEGGGFTYPSDRFYEHCDEVAVPLFGKK